MTVNTVTITSVAGPGLTVTSQVINNVTSLTFDYVESVIRIATSDGPVMYFAYSPVTTVTYTISGGNATVTIS